MVKYVIQRYSRYPIYEPAEGGYYYEGREPDNLLYATYNTFKEAVEGLQELVKRENEGLNEDDEGYLCLSVGTKVAEANSCNHKYVGAGCDWYVEPINRRGRHKEGWKPYC